MTWQLEQVITPGALALSGFKSAALSNGTYAYSFKVDKDSPAFLGGDASQTATSMTGPIS